MTSNLPPTDAQKNALTALRAMWDSIPFSYGTAESVEQRTRDPEAGSLPSDVTVRIETAPPSTQPDPILLKTGALKKPERVPVYFFSLTGSQVEADSEETAKTRVIFFIHGGGNVHGHPTISGFMEYYAHLIRTVEEHSGGTEKCVLVAPSYRLATIPENAFPAALQDLLAAYHYVVGKGYKPSNIVLAGDSAGGNHIILLTHLLLQSRKPSPHGIIAIAPGSIQSMELLRETAERLAGHDVNNLETYQKMASAYIGDSGLAAEDPLISGSFLPFTAAWPKVLVLVGTADILIDGARELQRRLAAINRPVELVEYDNLPHLWWIAPQIFPREVQDSAERIAKFVLE